MHQPAEPDSGEAVSVRDAAILGLLHGPAELLPISSSGHVTLVAWLTGMPYAEVPSERRKTVEIALHAGTALAIALVPPIEGTPGPKGLRGLALRAGMLVPTAAIGLAARDSVKAKLGTPRTIVAGLTAGSAAMLATAWLPGDRKAADATVGDGIALGISQSVALWPGFSRSGAAAVAGRLRGFSGGEAARLARTGLVTTSLAASALEIGEAAASGKRTHDLPAVAVGAATGFASAILARPLATRLERNGNIVPWALWRLALATAALLRIRSLSEDAKQ